MYDSYKLQVKLDTLKLKHKVISEKRLREVMEDLRKAKKFEQGNKVGHGEFS